MPKDLTDLANLFDFLEKEILKEGPAIAQEIAINGAALAIHRIQKEGVSGAQYSTNKMLATENMFNRKASFKQSLVEETRFHRDQEGKKKTKNGDEKKVVKRKLWIKFPRAKKAIPIMILPGGYKQLRELNGLQSAHVDLTFSGRMMQNIKLVAEKQEGAKFLAVIGATTPEEKKKLYGNHAHYGNFLDPTAEEKKIINPIPLNRIRKIFDKVLK
jgi:hypothetical protein